MIEDMAYLGVRCVLPMSMLFTAWFVSWQTGSAGRGLIRGLTAVPAAWILLLTSAMLAEWVGQAMDWKQLFGPSMMMFIQDFPAVQELRKPSATLVLIFALMLVLLDGVFAIQGKISNAVQSLREYHMAQRAKLYKKMQEGGKK